jgi:hypothetical protein
MKDFICNILIYISVLAAVVSFWIWIGTLLIWKIFAIAGAASLIFPAFFIMIGGIVGVIMIAIYYVYS